MAADQTSEVTVPYICPFPSGTEQVDVEVKAVLPVTARTGETIRPQDVSVAVPLPRSALTRFTALEAATLSATAELTVRNTNGDHTADASWQQLEAPEVALPPQDEGEKGEDKDTDGVVLTATGEVPTVAFGTPGPATLAPAGLTLTLSSFTEDGAPTTPPHLTVVCAPADDEERPLARITVRDGAGPASPHRTPPPPARTRPNPPRRPSARPPAWTRTPTARSRTSPRRGSKPSTTRTPAAAPSRSRPSGS